MNDSIGIDISKDTLDAYWLSGLSDFSIDSFAMTRQA